MPRKRKSTPRETALRHLPDGSDKKAVKDARYRMIARLMLAGIPARAIAKKTNFSSRYICTLKRKEAFQNVLREVESELFAECDQELKAAHKYAAKHLLRAVNTLGQMLKSEDPDTVFGAVDRLAKITGSYVDSSSKKDSDDGDAGVNIQQLVAVFEKSQNPAGAMRQAMQLTQGPDGSYTADGSN